MRVALQPHSICRLAVTHALVVILLLQVRSSVLFTLKQHVNTLAPLEDNELWAVLHNLGQVRSRIPLPDRAPCRTRNLASVSSSRATRSMPRTLH